jgi:hypothetical protein
MILRPVVSFVAAILLAAAAGCASDGVEVTTNADPLATFPSQGTFVWDDAGNKLPKDERIQELDLDPLIRQAANGAFAARGYREVASEPADFRLVYEVGENRWSGPDGVTSVVSISLILKDPKSGRHVWLGFGRAEVQPNVPREDRGRRLRSAFDEMLAKFPPTSPSS